MRILRVLITAALLAAVFVLALPAAADDCPESEPACHLAPLQSRQVNPFPATSSGDLSSLVDSSSLNVIDFTSPFSLGSGSSSSVGADPVFAELIPLPSNPAAPAFDRLDVRQRYQNPNDVSCGVQALGMALDGLGSPGPTSSALLDYLDSNGMLYDFGTGVEELAFAAQSFGYADSLPFHGGSLALLQSELAAGRPVVVDLGVNGEDQPGHFVTVTGVSPDGSWVAFNDPTLGEQVIPAAEFLTLWSRQGASGVLVGGAPATALAASSAQGHPSPFNASPWMLILAGMMALISNAGLGLWREGVGGMLAQGTGGGGGGMKPVAKPTKRSSSSSSSKKKKKDKKKKASKPPAPEPPQASAKGLLGNLQSGARGLLSTVTSAVSDAAEATRSKLNQVAASAASASAQIVNRLGTSARSAAAAVGNGLRSTLNAVGSAVSNAAEAVATTASGAVSFLKSELEDLKRASVTNRRSSPQAQSTPSPVRAPKPPEPRSTPVPPGVAASSQSSGSGQRGSTESPTVGLPLVPDNLLDHFPSISVPFEHKDIVSFTLGLLEWGHHYGWTYVSQGDDGTSFSPYNWSKRILGVNLQVSKEELSFKATLPIGRQALFTTDDDLTFSRQQSASMKITYAGWNTTSEVAYNSVDYTIAAGDGEDDRPKVSGYQGFYAKDKPLQVDASLVAVQAAAATLALGYGLIAPALSTLIGKGLSLKPGF